MKFPFITSIPFLILFTACDPGKHLIIKADPAKNISVSVYASESMLPYKEYSKEKIVITIPSGNPVVHDTTFFYGIGNWPGKSISDLAGRIDSIVFNNSSGRLVLNNKNTIEAYLQKNKTGRMFSVLTIKAE